MTQNYYQTLALKRGCADDEIASAYKKMVLRWHPKFAKENQNTAQHYFQQISQAYEVLSDPIKRAFYDKYGWQKLRQGLFQQGQLKGGYRFAKNPDQIFQKFFLSNNTFSKVFDKEIQERGSMFGHSFGALNYKSDVEIEQLLVDVPCTLNQLYMGVAKKVSYSRRVLNADGRTTSMREQERLIDIKPGYDEDNVLRFANEGHQNISRSCSTLTFKIKPQTHPKFSRQNCHLIYNADISLIQALNCSKFTLTTLDNRILKVSIDEIINPKTLKQVIGEGMPILQSKGLPNNKGNLYIKFNIRFPKQLSQDKKQQLRTLLP